MRKQLTEPEAWRRVARKVAAAKRPFDHGFLCVAASRLHWNAHISIDVLEAMDRRVREHLLGKVVAYVPDDESSITVYRQARVLAALWLALEAEEDSNAPR